MIVFVGIDKVIQTIKRLYQKEQIALLEPGKIQFEYLWDPSQDLQGEDLDRVAIVFVSMLDC